MVTRGACGAGVEAAHPVFASQEQLGATFTPGRVRSHVRGTEAPCGRGLHAIRHKKGPQALAADLEACDRLVAVGELLDCHQVYTEGIA